MDIREIQPHRETTGSSSALVAAGIAKPAAGVIGGQPRRVSARFFLAVCLPIIAAFGILYGARLSVPYQDDYGVILSFANDYAQLHGVKAKALDVATKQSNDYKLAFAHFIVAMELELTGHLNFSFLIILGNLFLLPIAFLLWRVHRSVDDDLNRQVIEFIPISLIFFSLGYWESLNWAMAGLQNLPVILFSLLAIYLLIPRGGGSPCPFRLALACVASMLAAFSSANGFLLAPVGAFVLVRRRAYIASLVWCASFLLPFAAYVYHYVPYHVSVDTMHRRVYLAKIFYFFAFLGCAIPFRWVAAFLGITILAVFVLAVRSRFERTHPVSFYFTVWILVTTCLVAWVRKGIAPRYSIYSLFLLIFCYWFLGQYLPGCLVSFSRKRFCVISIVLATPLCLLSDVRAYVYLKERQRMVLSGIERYGENPQINSPMIDPKVAEVDPKEAEFERVTLGRAIQQQVYALPPMR